MINAVIYNIIINVFMLFVEVLILFHRSYSNDVSYFIGLEYFFLRYDELKS